MLHYLPAFIFIIVIIPNWDFVESGFIKPHKTYVRTMNFIVFNTLVVENGLTKTLFEERTQLLLSVHNLKSSICTYCLVTTMQPL